MFSRQDVEKDTFLLNSKAIKLLFEEFYPLFTYNLAQTRKDTDNLRMIVKEVS